MALVGPPLVLTIIFCFALVLVQPSGAEDTQSRTSSGPGKQSGITAGSRSSKPKIKSDLSTKAADQDKASQIRTAPSGASGDQAEADTPQAPHGDEGNSPQAAVQNDGSLGNDIKSVAKPVKQTLDNFTDH